MGQRQGRAGFLYIWSMEERLQKILAILRREYPDRQPLLVYATPFQLLVAVILSAQTTDAGVNKVTPELFARYPDPPSLAAAPLAELERIIHPLGFFHTKAVNIKKTAALVAERFRGSVPREMDDLLTLPGVGRKTAGVLRAALYGLPAVIVDTHCSRVALRLGVTTTRDPARAEREIAARIPEADWSDFSMTVNRHGRRYCTARSPRCPECPLLGLCPFPEK